MSYYPDQIGYLRAEIGWIWTNHTTWSHEDRYTRMVFHRRDHTIRNKTYRGGSISVTFGVQQHGQRMPWEIKAEADIGTAPFLLRYDPEQIRLITDDPSDKVILITDYDFNLDWFDPVHPEHPRARVMANFPKQWR